MLPHGEGGLPPYRWAIRASRGHRQGARRTLNGALQRRHFREPASDGRVVRGRRRGRAQSSEGARPPGGHWVRRRRRVLRHERPHGQWCAPALLRDVHRAVETSGAEPANLGRRARRPLPARGPVRLRRAVERLGDAGE